MTLAPKVTSIIHIERIQLFGNQLFANGAVDLDNFVGFSMALRWPFANLDNFVQKLKNALMPGGMPP